jgi:hypothetical protein
MEQSKGQETTLEAVARMVVVTKWSASPRQVLLSLIEQMCYIYHNQSILRPRV